jgi:hypothetical protein
MNGGETMRIKLYPVVSNVEYAKLKAEFDAKQANNGKTNLCSQAIKRGGIYVIHATGQEVP